jgi:hypothetical protein
MFIKNKYIMLPGLATFNNFVDIVGYNKARLLTEYGWQRKYVYYWQN